MLLLLLQWKSNFLGCHSNFRNAKPNITGIILSMMIGLLFCCFSLHIFFLFFVVFSLLLCHAFRWRGNRRIYMIYPCTPKCAYTHGCVFECLCTQFLSGETFYESSFSISFHKSQFLCHIKYAKLCVCVFETMQRVVFHLLWAVICWNLLLKIPFPREWNAFIRTFIQLFLFGVFQNHITFGIDDNAYIVIQFYSLTHSFMSR